MYFRPAEKIFVIIFCLCLLGCLFMIISVICRFCFGCKKKQHKREVHGETPIVVTCPTNTAPVLSPVATQQPPGANSCQTNPFYLATAPQQAMPMPRIHSSAGVQSNAPIASLDDSPPSYDMVIAAGLAEQPDDKGYQKQSAHNPNYTIH